MGGISDALTGGGARDAADAQAQAGALSKAAQQEALKQALVLQERALADSQEKFQIALDLGEPYRAAGATALANYESFLYGIPVEQTPSYISIQGQRERSQIKNTEIPEGAVPYGDPGSGKFRLGEYSYKDFGGEILRQKAGVTRAPFEKYVDVDLDRDMPLPQDLTALDPDREDFRQAAIEQTPGYQFRLEEGQKAVERGAAARSGTLSGRQSKALQRYGQDVATAEFDNILRRIGGLVDTGSASATNAGVQALQTAQTNAGILGRSADLTYNTGQGVAQSELQIGAARASGYLGTQAAGTNILNMASSALGASGGFGGFGGGAGNITSSAGFNPGYGGNTLTGGFY